MTLVGKKIVLGVCGSIAAYKTAFLTRLLVKAGAEVRIIMSASAFDFITPLTLATLSKNPVLSKFQKDDTGVWNNHVELGLWADLFLVAPLSANTLAKFSNGICDNLLTATYLSARCPVMLAPAMDLDMYQHPAVVENLQKLSRYGNRIIDAESGELASGLYGQGRMAEPEHILHTLETFFSASADYKGKNVLITMGPTQEALDPVRFISNHSSGKMGLALANAFLSRGAEVYVVSGPISVTVDRTRFNWRDVKSAKEMYAHAAEWHAEMDICVFAAAVSDYGPADISPEKIKKDDSELTLKLVKNVDIAKELGAKKKTTQIHVGFALETENEAENAKGKLSKKNFDLIVLNSMRDAGAGFQLDTNKVRVYQANGMQVESDVEAKGDIAEMILDQIKNIPVWV
ncbi:bifunctional phosphopantothenoylcysteine decarboxylase/phosphopantothenate--cysteine ligase CoaBC [Algoriphagus halophytocola]|uniref:Coenzyme A biosynthesis bifunctional protein CoaBC n=1 Tax=Algoriphagus halophytocola TaxID=2991499 RepID=A0ABY6MHN0_9BACT|nr:MULTISPECIES: bifunctional phosphopantothenoylcysteine decarboxylase/phosphopantothenate--cysteine ligase CoaBC [unclassified Algoriphagus]UZD22171.1 bifunctional phosphopantothenoylcysteine decarboxylase/phosphopantothenate--cysteine ligase CoaBC [Algoriphagus sp. TR-M5]WBL43422.1 bifunctional phosphopantothenoylcysteine decarboxylase/phosphopantothenate--cysteine ligase CoaBC [Algoriphagus sp. TR-M9]